MANRNNQHIYSPSFSEMAYRIFRCLTAEEKGRLTQKEQALLCKDEHTLQKFCKEERIDYIAHLITKSTCTDWSLNFEFTPGSMDVAVFNSQGSAQYPQKRIDNTEYCKKNGICIISSRDVINSIHLLAQNITSKVYYLSQFAQDMKQKGRDLKQITNWDNQLSSAQESMFMFNNILLEQLNSLAYAEEVLDLELNDIRILSALYAKKDVSIKMKDIAELTRAKGKKMYHRVNLLRLLEKGLIAGDEKGKAKTSWADNTFFTITTKGIDRVMQYHKYIWKNAFGVGD